MIGYIIIAAATIFVIGYFTIGMMKIERNEIFMGGAIIAIALFIGSLYLDTTLTLKEFTVYQNGNIEIKGTNYFGDNDTHRFSFSECNVIKGSSNTYSGFGSKIKLNSEYYEQYKTTLKDEKSVTIEIKK